MTKCNFSLLKRDMQKMSDEWLSLGEILKKVIYYEDYDAELEKQFLSLKNTIGRHQKVLARRIPQEKEFDFGGIQITNMLKSQIVSLTQVSNRNDQDKKKIMQDWHHIYIQIQYVLGAFIFIESNEQRKPGTIKRAVNKVLRQNK